MPSLLEGDIFERFVISCVGSISCHAISTAHILLIHYMAEVVKCVIGVVLSRSTQQYMMNNPRWLSDAADIPFGPRKLLKYLFAKFDLEPSEQLLSGTYRMLQRFVLPFLRKSLLFVHVYESVLYPDMQIADEPESDRICRLLGLPSLAELLDLDLHATHIHMLIQNWMLWWRQSHPKFDGIELSDPTVFELIGLPERLDMLFEYASNYHCKKCNQVPDEPGLCLLCGQVVCTQSPCCENRSGGEMNSHRREFIIPVVPC
jgi:hypothetical protein